MRTISSADDFVSSIQESVLVVAKFETEWCGPCKQIRPVVDQLAKAHRDVLFARVDTDAHDDLAAQYHITTIPTFLFFVRGQLVDTLKGANVQHLKQKVDGLHAVLKRTPAPVPVPSLQPEKHEFFDVCFPSVDVDWNLGVQYEHFAVSYVVVASELPGLQHSHADSASATVRRTVDALLVVSPGRAGSLRIGDIVVRYWFYVVHARIVPFSADYLFGPPTASTAHPYSTTGPSV